MRAASVGTVALGLLVSAAFAVVAVRGVHLDDVAEALGDVSYGWLAAGLAAFAGWFFIRVARWQSLFDAGRRPSYGATCIALFYGYLFNNVLPARAGEAVRIAVLHRRGRTSVAETTATVVIERVFDVLSLLLLLFVIAPWLPPVTWLDAAAILGAVLLAAVVVGALALARYGDRPFAWLFRHAERLPYLGGGRLEHAAANMGHGFLGLRRVSTGLVAFGLTTLSWLVLGASCWFVMLAFDLGLSPLAGLLVVIGVGLAMILPSSPGALGVFEGATVVVLQAYGVAASAALSYALVLHALNLLPFLVLGLPVLLALRGRRRSYALSVPEEAADGGPVTEARAAVRDTGAVQSATTALRSGG